MSFYLSLTRWHHLPKLFARSVGDATVFIASLVTSRTCNFSVPSCNGSHNGAPMMDNKYINVVFQCSKSRQQDLDFHGESQEWCSGEGEQKDRNFHWGDLWPLAQQLQQQ